MTRMTVEQAFETIRTPLARKVLDYVLTFKKVLDDSKASGLSLSSWTPLRQLIAVDEFERVGVAKEVMDWSQYCEFLTKYAGSTTWEGVVRRVTEVPGLVFLELEEHNTTSGILDIANTVTVYEFDNQHKIRHLDVYLQGGRSKA